MSRIKVFGGHLSVPSFGHVRAFVAATSRKRAAKLVGLSPYEFRKYWAETGNHVELLHALGAPETVFYFPGDVPQQRR